MMSRIDQVERVIVAWTARDAEKGIIRTDQATARELARIAVTALECGEQHPDRPNVRCTEQPHNEGHLYHRSNGYGLVWTTSGDDTTTVHDVLGPIQLVQAPVRPDVSIRVPFIGGETDPGSRQEQQPGRYHTLPPCDGDAELATDPACICDDSPESDKSATTGHNRTCPVHSEILRDALTCRDADTLSVSGGNEADRAVYRDLFPILDYASVALYRIANAYRDGKPRITAELCRTAEDVAQKLAKSSTMLQEMTGTGTDA